MLGLGASEARGLVITGGTILPPPLDTTAVLAVTVTPVKPKPGIVLGVELDCNSSSFNLVSARLGGVTTSKRNELLNAVAALLTVHPLVVVNVNPT